MVSRRWVWVDSMGVASECGCKEVYRFPLITYPYSVLFSSSIPTFVHLKKCFLFLFVLIEWYNMY